MFKICVIGCGAMSVSGHGPAFKKYKNDYSDVALAGCCDIDAERAEEYKKEFGFEKSYTDYKQMIREIKPDAVSLISPVSVTCEMAIEIMKMGCNIILEKPPGKNLEELNRMIAQAKESNVNVRTAFNRRYTPLLIALKEMLAKEGEAVKYISYQMLRHNRLDDDFSTTAIHALDVAKDIVGAPYKQYSFEYQKCTEAGEHVKNVYMTCSFENGAAGQFALLPISGSVNERITVTTQNHSYFVTLPFWKNFDSPGQLVHIKENGPAEVIDGSTLTDTDGMFEESGFYEENRSFFEHIRKSGEIICDLESAIQSVELEDCIRNSK